MANQPTSNFSFSSTKTAVNTFFSQKLNLTEPWEVSFATVGLILGGYYAYKTINLFNDIKDQGLKKYAIKKALKIIAIFPAAAEKIAADTDKVLAKMEAHLLAPADPADMRFIALPEKGIPRDQLLEQLKKWSNKEREKWRNGQVSGGIYHGGEELQRFCAEAYALFSLSNPLHAEVFPFVRKMEAEVVSMTLKLFNGLTPEHCGVMTSGGTESIIMAVKAYRDWARSVKGISHPELIVATTVHAAFEKAADMLQMKIHTVGVDPKTFQVDVKQMKSRINRNTCLLVCSAPCFPQGVIDDVVAVAALAKKYNVGLHVDCCLGSFLIPFVNRLGYDIQPFDFSVDGVTSISADTHKYGFSPKGTSVIMFSTKALRHHMFFVAADWTGGIYASPSLPGSRPGGLIAATWAALTSMGEDGYMECARSIMQTADKLRQGIAQIKGLTILGKSELSVISFAIDHDFVKQQSKQRQQEQKLSSSSSSSVETSPYENLHIYKVGEGMGRRGWNLNTLQNPSSIHICVTYLHHQVADKFIQDLKETVAHVMSHPDDYKNGSAAIYGMAETIPDASLVVPMAKGFLDCLYKA